MSSKFSIKKFDGLIALKERCEFCKTYKPEHEQAAIYQYLALLTYYYGVAKKAKVDKEILKKLNEEFKVVYKQLHHKTFRFRLFRFNKTIYRIALNFKMKLNKILRH